MPLLQRHLSECWKTELPQIKIQLLPALLLSHFSYACHPPIWSIKRFPCFVLKYYKIVKSVNKYSTYITVCQPMEDISSLCSQNIHIFQRRCNRICSVCHRRHYLPQFLGAHISRCKNTGRAAHSILSCQQIALPVTFCQLL